MKDSHGDPFQSGAYDELLFKQIQKRWGLTIVSFLPKEARAECVATQKAILARLDQNIAAPTRLGKAGARKRRNHCHFYGPNHLHCTHMTLARSDPKGPVRPESFLKPEHSTSDLISEIQLTTQNCSEISVALDELHVSNGGIEVVLVGECKDTRSIQSRRRLLELLNERLPKRFNISRRPWDLDPSQFSRVHCSIGYLLKGRQSGYQEIVQRLASVKFAPIVMTFEEISLVHHRYRSLRTPNEGRVDFRLGRTDHRRPEVLSRSLGLG